MDEKVWPVDKYRNKKTLHRNPGEAVCLHRNIVEILSLFDNRRDGQIRENL